MDGTLKDHADAAAMRGNVLRKDVLAIEKNFALEPGVTHGFVHAVEGAKQRGLAATGGPMSEVTLLVAMPMLISKRTCLLP